MSNDLVKYEAGGQEVTLSKDIVRKYLVNGAGNVTDQEVTMFLGLCKHRRLNPFTREVYLIKRPLFGCSGARLATFQAANYG